MVNSIKICAIGLCGLLGLQRLRSPLCLHLRLSVWYTLLHRRIEGRREWTGTGGVVAWILVVEKVGLRIVLLVELLVMILERRRIVVRTGT